MMTRHFFGFLAVGSLAAALSVAPCQTVFSAPASVLTYHNDNFRTGLNSNETILAPWNVNSNSFGKLFAYRVDGYVYAQPLYVAGVAVPGQGVHNLLFVATEHNSVYALEADSNRWFTNGVLWQRNLGPSAITPTNAFGNRYNGGMYTDIVPEVGITGTPVIDLERGTIFVDAFTREASGYIHRIHALNITNGLEQPNSPVVVAASIAGTGVDNVGGVISFKAIQQIHRCALTLAGGTLYAAYSGYADTDPYHGWVIGFDEVTLQVKPGYVFNTSPNASTSVFGANAGEAGIWMGGGGLCVDTATNLYFETANGSFSATNGSGGIDYGDSFVKLSTANGLQVADYFTVWDQLAIGGGAADTDLGSGACMLIPPQPGTNLNLIVGGGKSGKFYVLNRDQLTTDNTHYNATGRVDRILQTFTNYPPGRFMTGPAYFNGAVYYSSWGDKMKSYPITNGVLSLTPKSTGPRTFAFPGCTPVISSSGTNNGIIWSVAMGTPAVLTAYNATNVSTEIYNSAQAAANRDALTNGVKFVSAMTANGKVYAGGTYSVGVFGLLDPGLNWKAFHFANNATNTAVAGDLADPDSDGLANLFEYAVGTDPNVPTPGNTLGAVLVTNRAQLSFNRNAAASDLTYVVETSTNLVSWSSALTFTPALGWVSSGTASVTEAPPSALPPDQTVAATIDLGAPSPTVQFARLRVHR